MTFCKLHVFLCFSFICKRTIVLRGINLQSRAKMTIYEYTRTTKCFQFCHLSTKLGDLHRKGFGDWGILNLVIWVGKYELCLDWHYYLLPTQKWWQ